MHVSESDLRRVFQASLWLKGAHSLAEVLGGLALAFSTMTLSSGSSLH